MSRQLEKLDEVLENIDEMERKVDQLDDFVSALGKRHLLTQ